MSTPTTTVHIPPYDPELVANAASAFPPALTNDADYAVWRDMPETTAELIQPLLDQLDLVHEDIEADLPTGKMTIAVIRPRTLDAAAPAIYDIHGGGMIFGNRFASYLPETLEWAADLGAVILSPEYTLCGPDARAPQAAEECYAGLLWIMDHASELVIDPRRIILAGVSGGGGLAAAVGLLARDGGGPALHGQMLLCPQLDDRHTTPSSLQFTLASGAIDPWPGETNEYAWNRILGEGHETADVSIYQAPARATDLSGLPQTFIDVGGNEVFRDPAIEYASKLLAGGVSTELHVWPGGFHGFDTLVPTAAVSRDAKKPRRDWLRRVLAP